MQKLFFLFLLFLFVFSIKRLKAQELTQEVQQFIEEELAGCSDAYFALVQMQSENYDEALQSLEKSKQFYIKNKEWDHLGNAIKHSISIHLSLGKKEKAFEETENGLSILKDYPEGNAASVDLYTVLFSLLSQNHPVEKDRLIVVGEEALPFIREYYQLDTAYLIAPMAITLGACYGYIGAMEKAEESYQIASNVLDYQGDCPNCFSARLLLNNSMGTTYRHKKNYEKTFDLLESALKMSIQLYGENEQEILPYYSSLLMAYYKYGQLNRTKSYLKRILQIVEKGGKDVSENTLKYKVFAEMGLAQIAIEEGQLDLALSYLNEAKRTAIPVEDPILKLFNHEITYSTIFRMKGDFDLAEQYISRVDSIIATRQYEDNDPDKFKEKVIMLTAYADLYESNKDYDKAKAIRQKITQDYYSEKNVLGDYIKDNFLGLSNLYNQIDHLDSALLYAHKALLEECSTFTIQDVTQSPNAKDLNLGISAYAPLENKIELLHRKANASISSEKRSKWIETSFQHIDLHDQYHQGNLKKINFFRVGRGKTMIEQSINVYKTSIQVAADIFEEDGLKMGLQTAFYNTQKFKAQQLLLAQLKTEATSYFNLDKAFTDQERDLLADIQYYNQQAYEALQENNNKKADEIKSGILLLKENAYQELLREMEQKYPDYYEAKYTFQAETSETLQAILQPNELIIEYVLIDSAIYVFTLSKEETLQLQIIPFNTKTIKHIDALQSLLKNSAMNRPASRQKFIDISHQLYQQFIQPIEGQLVGKEQLIIIGDGMTNHIPFELLIPSNELKPFRELDYLIRNQAITYNYSSALFAKTRKKQQPSFDKIFAFAPVYESDNDKDSSTTRFYNTNLKAIEEDGNFSPLPESEKEVKAIEALFNQNGEINATISLREKATEIALKTNLEKPYQFIHIAGHSFADIDNPKFSGIACFEIDDISQDTLVLKEDDILYAGEIYNIRTQADLITLSSCESGYGKLEKTEGLLGLNRAFIYAGTPNVVFSLWKVYDKVSAELMVDFYKNVLEGKDYSQSLRQAKLDLLKAKKTASPHYWGPYLLIGR